MIATSATDFVAAQREFAARDAGAPGWLRALRGRSLERFLALGLPSPHDEEWRFTSIRPILERSFVPVEPDTRGTAVRNLEALNGLSAGPRMTFLDGALLDAARASAVPNGMRISRISDAIRTAPDLLEPHLGQWASTEGGAFAALGAAFLGDGAFVRVPRGARLTTPIVLVHATSGAGRMTHPQSLVLVEAEADVTIAEVYASAGGRDYFTNATTTVVIGNGARVRHYRLQQEAQSAVHVATSRWTIGRDAQLESCSVALGGMLARHQLLAVLDGQNASLTMDGLSVLSGAQHGDHHTVIDHAKPHCESHEVFNGVFAGDSRGVFNGRIVVRPGAQRTDSKQTSNNLLLSDRARADAQPQLEIYADDVKCTHGATLGPLDETALFYLLSRGFDRSDARTALTFGFAAEILTRIGSEEVRTELEHAIRAAVRAALGSES